MKAVFFTVAALATAAFAAPAPAPAAVAVPRDTTDISGAVKDVEKIVEKVGVAQVIEQIAASTGATQKRDLTDGAGLISVLKQVTTSITGQTGAISMLLRFLMGYLKAAY